MAKSNLPPWGTGDDIAVSIERLKLLADEAHRAGNSPLAKALYDSIAKAATAKEMSDIRGSRVLGPEARRALGSAFARLGLQILNHIPDEDTRERATQEFLDGIVEIQESGVITNSAQDMKAICKAPESQR